MTQANNDQSQNDLIMVQKNGLVLGRGGIAMTPKVCMAAVQQNGMALMYVGHQTPELCLAAVQNDGMALEHVREQTVDVQLAAIQENPNAARFIDEKTKALIHAVIDNIDMHPLY